jgi:proteasome accessory factor C
VTSPRTAERLSRLLAMLPWVIANPGASVAEICERFGYERAELVKDLKILFVCGLPGYGPGDLMEAYIDEDEVVIDMAEYFARPIKLTAAESLMMLAGGMAMISAGSDDPALISAVDKLTRAILPERGLVDIDLQPEPALVEVLRRAAADCEVVHLKYTSISSGETTERDVEPWAVFASMGNWYMSGHCRLAADERVFRVDRVREARPTGARFDPPDEPPEAGVHYTPGVDDITVEIKLSPGAAWVAEYYPVTVVDDAPDGKTIVFSAGDVRVLSRLLARLGEEAKVVGGKDRVLVLDALADLKKRVLTRYK